MKQNGGNIFAGMRCLCFCHVFLGTVVRGRISMAPKRFSLFVVCEVTVLCLVLFVVFASKALEWLRMHVRACFYK